MNEITPAEQSAWQAGVDAGREACGHHGGAAPCGQGKEMNTHDKYELPPLPEWLGWPVTVSEMTASEVKEEMQAYALAAIEADRKRRGEPVPKGWKLVPETPTSKQIVHMACQIKGSDADGWFRTDGDDWHQHVDAAERAYKWALSEAPQPAESIPSNSTGLGEAAEPVKEPSDQQILKTIIEFGTHVDGDTTVTFTGAGLLSGCRAILARYR